MRAKDVLLEALSNYSGTVIFVSHDRYFIDRLATRVLEIENGALIAYEGNYEDYLRRKETLTAATAVNASASTSTPETPLPHSSHSEGWEATPPARHSGNTIVIEGGFEPSNGGPPKKEARRLNPIKQKQMEDRCKFLEEEIPRVESSIAHTDEQLSVYVSAAKTQRLADLAAGLRAQLAALTTEWEELTAQLES
jgi:ATP-binding cassette subfamily F protein 3